jgi:hypothetical protein
MHVGIPKLKLNKLHLRQEIGDVQSRLPVFSQFFILYTLTIVHHLEFKCLDEGYGLWFFRAKWSKLFFYELYKNVLNWDEQ